MSAICAALKIGSGITTIIGSGGKSTLLSILARELPGRVILCTTTKIYPIGFTLTSPSLETLDHALRFHKAVCVGGKIADGKIGPPAMSMEQLQEMADYVIVEGDGAAGKPLKAHAPYEPVIPPQSTQTIQVVGFSGIGRPIEEAAHRPERYAQIAGAAKEDLVTPEIAAAVINREHLCHRVLINQVDQPAIQAEGLAAALEAPAVLGSLQKGWVKCLF